MNYDDFLTQNKTFTAVAFYTEGERRAIIVGASFPKVEFLGLVKFTNEKSETKITFSNFVAIEEDSKTSWPEVYENVGGKLESFDYELVEELEIPEKVIEELINKLKDIAKGRKFEGKEELMKVLSEPELEFEI